MSLDPETTVRNLGVALGLLDGAEPGIAPSMDFFRDPLAHLRGILGNDTQREALGAFLDEVVPGPPGATPGWHPLLWEGDAAPARGNLFLTLEDDGLVGIAGEVHSGTSPDFRFQAIVPLVRVPAAGDPDVLIGTAAHPIRIRAELDLPPPTGDVRLAAIVLELDLVFVDGFVLRPILALRGFGRAGDVRDLEVDLGASLDAFARDAVEVALAALRVLLGEAPEPLKSHLLPALGLGTTGATLPLVDLAGNPAAFTTWLTTQLADPTTFSTWFGHIVTLLGAHTTTVPVTGAGTWGDPLRAALWAQTVGEPRVAVELTVAVSEGRLYPGLVFSIGPSAIPALKARAELVPVGIPLGAAAVDVLPVARLGATYDLALDTTLPAPGGGTGEPIKVGAIHAALDLSAGALRPVLELTAVTLGAHVYDRVDLTHTDAIAGLLLAAIKAQIISGVGGSDSAGAHLLALVAITDVVPEEPDPGRFLTDPLGEVLRWHRTVATSGDHDGWRPILGELARLLERDRPDGGHLSGAGTDLDPWAFDLVDPAGPLHVRAVAWRTGDLQLHLGVEVDLDEAPFRATLRSALIELQIPASGDPEVALFRTHDARIAIRPPPPLRDSAFGLVATDVSAGVRWVIGTAPQPTVNIDGVVFTIDGVALPAITLQWPTPAFAHGSEAGFASALGFASTAQLDIATRAIVRRAVTRFGDATAPAMLGVLGLGDAASGLPADFPALTSGFAASPEAALRPWLRQVLTGASASGEAFANGWLSLLGGLLADRLERRPSIVGAGVAGDPWRVALAETGEIQARLWLGPNASPTVTQALLDRATDTGALARAVAALRGDVPALGGALDPTDTARLSGGILALDAFFDGGDGLVPLISAAPVVAAWPAPITVDATHIGLLSDATVVAHVRALTTPVVVLGAPFLPADSVDPLLPPGADVQRVSFRVDGVPADRVDLSAVRAGHAWTVVALSGQDRTALAAQVRRLLDQLGADPVTIVAHSITGRAAVDVAADPTYAARITRVVTLGAPLLGGVPPYLAQGEAGLAVGVARALGTALPAGRITDALALAQRVVHHEAFAGGEPISAAALLDPVPTPTTPVVQTIAGRVGAGLGTVMASGLRAAAPALTPPDRVGAGVSWWFGGHAALHAVCVRTELFADLGEVGLADATLDAATRRLGVRITIDRGADWLIGGPGVQDDGAAWPARVRAASLSAVWDGTNLSLSVRLMDAAIDGAPALLDLDSPATPALLDVVFGAMAGTLDGDLVLGSLRALGLVLPDVPRLHADALGALRAQKMSWLAPRLRAAFDAPFFGHAPGVGWALPALDASLRVTPTGLALRIGSAARLGADATLTLPGFALSGSASLTLGGTVTTWSPGALHVGVPRWFDPMRVWPAPSADDLRGWLATQLPSVMLSVAADTFATRLLPLNITLPPLGPLFLGRAAGAALPGGLNATGLAWALRQLGSALGHPGHEGLWLPLGAVGGGGSRVGLLLDVIEAADRTRFVLSTDGDLAGVVGVALELGISPTFEVRPAGSLSLRVPGGDWDGVALRFSAAESGVALWVETGTVAPLTTIHLFPVFGGWSELLSGGVALLPHLLDQIVTATSDTPLRQGVLGVATAFDLYGPNFSTHTARFQDLAAGNLAYDRALRGQIVDAIVALVGAGGPLALPGGFARVGTAGSAVVSWSPSAGAVLTSHLQIDWTAEVPTLDVDVAVVAVAGDVAFAIGVDGHFALPAPDALDLDVRIYGELREGLGLGVTPRIEAGVDTDAGVARPILRLRPLGNGTAMEGAGSTPADPFALVLLPTPGIHPPALPAGDADALEALLISLGIGVLLPLVSRVLQAARGTDGLWAGGPTLDALVDATGLFDGAHLADPAPDLTEVVAGLLSVVRVQPTFGELTLTIGALEAIPASRVGVALHGRITIPIETLELQILFGELADEEVAVALFTRVGSTWAFAPRLSAEHFGLGVGGAEGRPMVATDVVRLGSVEAFTWFTVDFLTPGDSRFQGIGAGVQGFGITLGGGGGNNGVAKGMLSSARNGDGAAPQPGFGGEIAWFPEAFGEHGKGVEARLAGDDPRKTELGIRAAFGPVYIDAITLELSRTQDPEWFAIGITGGVSVSGFTAGVDNLSVRVPLPDPGVLADWRVDLDGLALAYSGSGVTVAGGLVRQENAQGIRYDGMLVVSLPAFGLVAVGSWAKVTDPAHPSETYDSFFLFAAASFTVAFPPYFTLTGIAAGFGYNRALIVPAEMDDIPSFALVAALAAGSSLADNPMAVLTSMGEKIPARRGSLWFAAGFKGQLFQIVDMLAVVYVALDGNVEIGVLGVASLIQPAAAPLVRIELAIKVRYSSAEQLFSMQAQLTENSWLLLPDVQLTGGFALFIWFRTGQFVLTIGGYHPSFHPAPEFPSVPRLGFRAHLSPVFTLKGEAYFALTNSAVMAGVRLEAAYDVGWLRAWFEAWADFLISWDPFHYEIGIGVRLGADFNIEIDLFFGTISVHFSFSVGASLRLWGPPLGGEVTAELGPISITVPFGADPAKPPAIDWPTFRARYIDGGESASRPIITQVTAGLASASSGEDAPDGSAGNPWVINAEWSLSTRSAFPVYGYTTPAGSVSGTAEIGIVPMDVATVHSQHTVTFTPLGSALPATFAAGSLAVKARDGHFPTSLYGDPKAGTVAEARNITAIEGLDLVASGVPQGTPTGSIDWAHLVDTGNPKPLPFAAHDADWRRVTVGIGDLADLLSERFRDADPGRLLSAGSPLHEGLPWKRSGADGSALVSLQARRRPPRVASLAEGMTLSSPGIGMFKAERIAPLPAVEKPELLLAFADRLPPAARAHAVVATTARAARSLPRTLPPRASVTAPGRLTLVDRSLPDTRAAIRPAAVAHTAAGRAAMQQVAKAARASGATLGPGAIQTWDVGPSMRVLHLTGDLARVVALGRADDALLDVELSGGDGHRLALPTGTRRVIVISLGAGPTLEAPGFGAASLRAAARPPVTLGWTTAALSLRADPTMALGRGCRIRSTQRDERTGLVRLHGVADRGIVETMFPAGLDAVLVAGRPGDDPFEVSVEGALAGAATEVEDGGGRGLLLPLTQAGPTTVTVLAGNGGLAGVLGFTGNADAILAALHGATLPSLLTGLALSGTGAVSIRFEGGES